MDQINTEGNMDQLNTEGSMDQLNTEGSMDQLNTEEMDTNPPILTTVDTSLKVTRVTVPGSCST